MFKLNLTSDTEDKSDKKTVTDEAVRKEIGEAAYMALLRGPSSKEADNLVSQLVEELWKAESQKYGPSSPFKRAVGAVVADLLTAGKKDQTRYSYRSFSANSFKALPVGYGAFKKVIDRAHRLGFIEFHALNADFDKRTTRFRATPKFFALADSFGIEAGKHRWHFRHCARPKTIPDPIHLKSQVRWRAKFRKEGEPLPVDMTCPETIKLGAVINEINRFMADQDIAPDCHQHFYRSFNNGDITPYRFNKGGRLISAGDSYQHMSQEERRLITINGEAVVELDLRASHLTIARAKLGHAFDPAADAYASSPLPRNVVKQCVNLTLGNGKFHKDWPAEVTSDFLKDETEALDLAKDYPFAEVKAEVLKILPFLSDWKSYGIGWADLQFWESEAIVNTVHELATIHGIPALPVHDSLIIPVSAQEKATEVLKRRFKDVVGIEPHLTVK